MKKPLILSIFNQKGGSSKSTTVLNMATALTYKSEEILGTTEKPKVLIIDNDGQANTTYICLGKNDDELIEEGIMSINDLMIKREMTVKEVICKTEFENVDIIPSTIDHIYTDMQLVSVMDNNRILKKKLEAIYDEYDFILIDNPPAISLTTYNALMAADCVIAPIESSVFSAKGLNNLIDLVEDMNETREDKLGLLTFLTKVDNRKGVKNIKAKKALENALGDKFIREQQISLLSVYTNALESGETAITYARKSDKGSNEYVNLTKLVLEKINK